MKTDLHGRTATVLQTSFEATTKAPPLKLEEMGFELTHNRQARNKRKGKYNSAPAASASAPGGAPDTCLEAALSAPTRTR
jgi:hypothetical protein